MSASSSLRSTLWPTPNLMGAIVSPVTNERRCILQRFSRQRKPLSHWECVVPTGRTTQCPAKPQQKAPGDAGALMVRREASPNSIPRDHRAAEPVVDANAQDVVRDPGFGANPNGRSVHQQHARAGILAEVHIEVLDLAGPVAAEAGFDARTDRPAGPGFVVAECNRAGQAIGTKTRDRAVGCDFADRKT